MNEFNCNPRSFNLAATCAFKSFHNNGLFSRFSKDGFEKPGRKRINNFSNQSLTGVAASNTVNSKLDFDCG